MREPNLYKREGVYWLRAKINGVLHRESLRTSDVKTARRARDARIEEIKGEADVKDRARAIPIGDDLTLSPRASRS